jgi:polyisoprenoid-binding protein YceI
MKTLRTLSSGALALAFAVSLTAADLTKFDSQPGSKVKIDGTSNIHDWTVEGGIIAGVMELDAKFAADPTKSAPGKVAAKVETTIPVRTLKSGKSSMDSVMHAAMKQPVHPKIEYRLTELTLKETPKSAEGPFLLESKGELAVAGVTNKVAFPVTMTRAGKVLKASGSTNVKMTSFGIEPPSPKISFGLIKTADDVKITFDWNTSAAEAK